MEHCYFLYPLKKNYKKLIDCSCSGSSTERLSDADRMLTVDKSGFVKKGNHSVDVARQYCESVGKVENCQVGVFLGYFRS